MFSPSIINENAVKEKWQEQTEAGMNPATTLLDLVVCCRRGGSCARPFFLKVAARLAEIRVVRVVGGVVGVGEKGRGGSRRPSLESP